MSVCVCELSAVWLSLLPKAYAECGCVVQATDSKLVGWSAFNSLDATCDIAVEWYKVLENSRPIAFFRPDDVLVVKLNHAAVPVTFWKPKEKPPARRRVARAILAPDAPEHTDDESEHSSDVYESVAGWSDAVEEDEACIVKNISLL